MAIALLDQVTDFYLSSGDFNGLPLSKISAQPGTDYLAELEQLVDEGRIEVISQNHYTNPHVKSLDVWAVADQRAALREPDAHHVCLYPSPNHLRATVDRSRYANTPFTLELALGAPQLDIRSFDLAVLEFYRNDPRYEFECGSTHGLISVSDDYFESENMPERDQVLLQSFGFSFDDKLNRAVAVFLCYLSRLSPEHQQVWRARELPGEYKLHPDYFRTQILGEWPEELCIFDAFLMELVVINQMSKAMNRPALFRNVPDGADLKSFTFLIRPTQAEFDAFVHTLDKLISENIDKAFFLKGVSDSVEEERADGKIVVKQKGTLQMLDEWVRKVFRTDDWTLWDDSIATMRKVRKLRQAPAHALRDDKFDQEFLRKQRELIVDAYAAVRTIRLVLAKNPLAKSVPVNDFLYEGKVRSY